MKRCIICNFPTEPDDVAVVGGPGRCVCIRCYSREVHTEHLMPQGLQRQVEQTLREMQ